MDVVLLVADVGEGEGEGLGSILGVVMVVFGSERVAGDRWGRCANSSAGRSTALLWLLFVEEPRLRISEPKPIVGFATRFRIVLSRPTNAPHITNKMLLVSTVYWSTLAPAPPAPAGPDGGGGGCCGADVEDDPV